jgi:hypothetical protein
MDKEGRSKHRPSSIESPQVAGSNNKSKGIKQSEREEIQAGIPTGVPASNTRERTIRTDIGGSHRVDPPG